jgi:hypothetical protein
MNSPDKGEGPIAGFINGIKKFVIHKWRGLSILPKIRVLLTS